MTVLTTTNNHPKHIQHVFILLITITITNITTIHNIIWNNMIWYVSMGIPCVFHISIFWLSSPQPRLGARCTLGLHEGEPKKESNRDPHGSDDFASRVFAGNHGGVRNIEDWNAIGCEPAEKHGGMSLSLILPLPIMNTKSTNQNRRNPYTS